jgi:hypothetical protein
MAAGFRVRGLPCENRKLVELRLSVVGVVYKYSFYKTVGVGHFYSKTEARNLSYIELHIRIQISCHEEHVDIPGVDFVKSTGY